MTRGLGLMLSLIVLVVIGAGYMLQNKSQGPTSAAVTQDESQAIVAATATSFSQVAQVLQADYAQSGTYVGAELPVGTGVTVAQATTTSYCLETTSNGTLVHEVGPGGSPVLGGC